LKIWGNVRKSRCTTGINETGGKFAAGDNPVANLLPVSTTSVENATTLAINLPLVLLVTLIPANLPPMSRTPVANNGKSIRLLKP
jgi:hypothetical protein